MTAWNLSWRHFKTSFELSVGKAVRHVTNSDYLMLWCWVSHAALVMDWQVLLIILYYYILSDTLIFARGLTLFFAFHKKNSTNYTIFCAFSKKKVWIINVHDETHRMGVCNKSWFQISQSESALFFCVFQAYFIIFQFAGVKSSSYIFYMIRKLIGTSSLLCNVAQSESESSTMGSTWMTHGWDLGPAKTHLSWNWKAPFVMIQWQRRHSTKRSWKSTLESPGRVQESSRTSFSKMLSAGCMGGLHFGMILNTVLRPCQSWRDLFPQPHLLLLRVAWFFGMATLMFATTWRMLGVWITGAGAGVSASVDMDVNTCFYFRIKKAIHPGSEISSKASLAWHRFAPCKLKNRAQ